MTAPDPELRQLLEEAANGELSPTDAKRLEARLKAEPEARRAWLEAMQFEAMLHEEFPQRADFSLPVQSLAGKPARRPSRLRQRLTLAFAAAACLAAGLLLWRDLSPRNVNPDVEVLAENEAAGPIDSIGLPVATVSKVEELADAAFTAGQRIRTGSLILTKGRVHLAFDCGALVTLEGPARLDVESDYRGFLHYGTLIARVPPQAQGFLILTPSSSIKDLGTEFALKVGKASGSPTDLHVLEGVVEATPLTGDGGTRRVEEQTALRITDEAMEDLTYSGEVFVRLQTVTPPAPVPPFTHWSFDQTQDADPAGTSKSAGLILMTGEVPTPQPAARSVAGRYARGLKFSGDSEYAQTDHPGIGGSEPRTVAFWIRMPRHPKVKNDAPTLPNGIVSWGEAFAASRKWQIGWNADPSYGTVGAVRQEFGQGYVVGSTDLRDDRWHHVAVVFHGGDDADVATHVKIYVDGRLDTVTGRKQQAIRTATSGGKAEPVTFGRYLGKWTKHPPFYFEGALDEVFLMEGAIDQAQVLQLMEHNGLK